MYRRAAGVKRSHFFLLAFSPYLAYLHVTPWRPQIPLLKVDPPLCTPPFPCLTKPFLSIRPPPQGRALKALARALSPSPLSSDPSSAITEGLPDQTKSVVTPFVKVCGRDGLVGTAREGSTLSVNPHVVSLRMK